MTGEVGTWHKSYARFPIREDTMAKSGRVVFSRMEEVRVRQAGRRVGGGAGRRTRRRARLPDGERHAQPGDRRDRQVPPRTGQPLRRHLRQDAAALAARGGDRRRRAGARGQGRSHRHPGRRLDHRRRQGRAALPRQRRHARVEALDQVRTADGPPPSSRPRCARSRSRPRCRPASSPASPASPTSATKVKELFRHPDIIPRPSCSIPR